MGLQEWIFSDLYRRARVPQALPWHRDEPPALLERAVAQRRSAGRALDLGCGTGVYAVYLAGKGYSVVGVDFVPAAIELARARAHAARVTIELVQADVVDFDPPQGFDLVLDSGCLHHVPRKRLAAYRARLDHWLAPGADYVLVHFAKRHALDWRPFGPRRRTREDIVRFISPLRLEAYGETAFRLAAPVGNAVAGVYWFRR